MQDQIQEMKYFVSLVLFVVSAVQVIFSHPNIFPQQPSVQIPTIPKSDVLGESVASDSAQVVTVIDGDTVRVSIDGAEKTIRLIGINTPETVDPRRKVECFGKEASNRAKEILQGQAVSLEADASQGNTDKYGRLLRYVWLQNGTNFNKQMIAEGYAYEYTYDLPYKYQSEFKQVQAETQNAKRGLWSDETCGGEK